jgi:hypothetical protein
VGFRSLSGAAATASPFIIDQRLRAGYRFAIAADPLSGLEPDLEAQRRFVSERAPAYTRLLELLADALADKSLRDRLRDAWSGRSFGAFYERPLLLLAALRDDALAEGTRPKRSLGTRTESDGPLS